MRLDVKKLQAWTIESLEFVLSMMIVGGICAYTWFSTFALFAMDWHQTSTFEEFVQRVLFAMIGIELLQVIRVHSLRDIFLASTLLLVRKALSPSSSTLEVVALVFAAICIIGFWQLFTRKPGSAVQQLSF